MCLCLMRTVDRGLKTIYFNTLLLDQKKGSLMASESSCQRVNRERGNEREGVLKSVMTFK